VKFSRREIFSREHKIPALAFEDQRLTSVAGLIMYQIHFIRIGIKESLRSCFRHLRVSEIFGHHVIMLVLIVHLLLGYRKLREMEYYKDDPMVKRVLGLRRLPDVSTVSRALRCVDDTSIRNVRQYCQSRVIMWLKKVPVYRVTLDFDGSVIVTMSRNTEGTAVGYNKRKKGARSYYPLFCTIAQTGHPLKGPLSRDKRSVTENVIKYFPFSSLWNHIVLVSHLIFLQLQVADSDRGRDACYQTPPAQIRTRWTTSYGSYLG
jgi:Transposase DDE domain group 1